LLIMTKGRKILISKIAPSPLGEGLGRGKVSQKNVSL